MPAVVDIQLMDELPQSDGYMITDKINFCFVENFQGEMSGWHADQVICSNMPSNRKECIQLDLAPKLQRVSISILVTIWEPRKVDNWSC